MGALRTDCAALNLPILGDKALTYFSFCKLNKSTTEMEIVQTVK